MRYVSILLAFDHPGFISSEQQTLPPGGTGSASVGRFFIVECALSEGRAQNLKYDGGAWVREAEPQKTTRSDTADINSAQTPILLLYSTT